MKNLVIVARWRAAFRDVLDQNQLVAFQLANLALIRTDDGRAVRVHNAVKKLIDLPFHGDLLKLECGATCFRLPRAVIPQIAEHSGRELDEFTRGRERAHERFQRIFHFRSCQGFAVAGAPVLAAHVVGIATALALGPRGGHGMVAIAAGDEAAHREIRVDVLAGWRTRLARQAILNDIEGFERDQAVMLPLSQ